MALRSFACLAFAIALQPERTMASLDGAVGGDCAGENPAACAADGDIAAVESWEADAMRMEMLQRRVSFAELHDFQNKSWGRAASATEQWKENKVLRPSETLGVKLMEFIQIAAQVHNVTEAIGAYDKFFELPNASEAAREAFEKGVISVDPASGDLIEQIVRSRVIADWANGESREEGHPITVGAELGALYGYSALRFARASSEITSGAEYYVVDPYYANVRDGIFTHAGVTSITKEYTGYSNDFLDMCAKDGVKLDFLLMDHAKELYLEDLQSALALGVLNKGALVLADNYGSMVSDLVSWIQSEEGKATLSSEVVTVPDCATVGQCDILVATVL